MTDEQRRDHEDPTIAPAMNTHDALEKKADKRDIERGEYTEVTRLFLDRTPED